MRKIALVVGMLAAVPAQAADRFDLKCEGTRSETVGEAGEPISFSVTIDLSSNRYCLGTCWRVDTIQEVQPDRIVFREESKKTLRERSFFKHEVDRQTGKYERLLIETYPFSNYLKEEAECVPAAFRGFPAAKF